jgi:hypothetical protein
MVSSFSLWRSLYFCEVLYKINVWFHCCQCEVLHRSKHKRIQKSTDLGSSDLQGRPTTKFSWTSGRRPSGSSTEATGGSGRPPCELPPYGRAESAAMGGWGRPPRKGATAGRENHRRALSAFTWMSIYVLSELASSELKFVWTRERKERKFLSGCLAWSKNLVFSCTYLQSSQLYIWPSNPCNIHHMGINYFYYCNIVALLLAEVVALQLAI